MLVYPFVCVIGEGEAGTVVNLEETVIFRGTQWVWRTCPLLSDWGEGFLACRRDNVLKRMSFGVEKWKTEVCDRLRLSTWGMSLGNENSEKVTEGIVSSVGFRLEAESFSLSWQRENQGRSEELILK